MIPDAHRLGLRALAAVARGLALPLEVWLSKGGYAPFAVAFTRNCDAAQAWIALGHSPQDVPRLELDGVEMRGSREERAVWGVLWSLSRLMEFARQGERAQAVSQLGHTLELIGDWPDELRDVAGTPLLAKAETYIEHAAATLPAGEDPPVDGETLAVPPFFVQDPAPQDALRPTQTSVPREVSFEEEVSELAALLREGRVAVFCGSGISIGSGIPDADSLRRELLSRLPTTQREVDWLTACDLPFEAFLETLVGQVGLGPLREIFVQERPGNAHVFLGHLAELGLLRTITTTNFDELLEKPLRCRSVAHTVAVDDDELVAADSEHAAVRVDKLHGTVSRPDTLGVSMQAVAGSEHLEARAAAITRIFTDGPHEAVLVLGYSCSDLFDVSPAIQALGERVKRVFLVDHSKGEHRAEDVRLATRKNPFAACARGARLTCDTDRLLERLAREFEGCVLPHRSGDDTRRASWRDHVARWWERVHRSNRVPVGHAILGELWYRCADHRAAKAHYLVALAAVSPRIVFHDPTGFGRPTPHVRQVVPPTVFTEALIRVGGCHRALSEYDQAMRRFMQAEEVARRHDLGDEVVAGIADSLGTVHFNRGEPENAVTSHERALELWRKLSDDGQRLGPCLANLGNAYGALGRLDDALACHNEAVAFARALGDKAAEGKRLGGLATVHRLRGELDEAERDHRASAAIAEDTGDRTGVAHQLGGLALVEEARGNPVEAIRLSQEALRLCDLLGDVQGAARLLGNAGSLFFRHGHAREGAELWLHTAERAASIGDASVLGNAVGGLEFAVTLAEELGADRADVREARRLLTALRACDLSVIAALRRVSRRLFQRDDESGTGGTGACA